LVLVCFVVAEVGTVSIVRMVVFVVAAAGCTAEAAEVAVDMVRKVS